MRISLRTKCALATVVMSCLSVVALHPASSLSVHATSVGYFVLAVVLGVAAYLGLEMRRILRPRREEVFGRMKQRERRICLGCAMVGGFQCISLLAPNELAKVVAAAGMMLAGLFVAVVWLGTIPSDA